MFDESEFYSYIINSIKKNDIHEYFYHYSKKMFEIHLIAMSKREISQSKESNRNLIKTVNPIYN